ncbi:hypothetical protein I204_07954 [Kwoniella mangroviensis CBS 8886]|uniref:uncharacterized protein n=1 Tax=Kwoniella mangroviensis CBS 8507 TaxID=1296122 RepID=UPI00080D7DF0|nr:uncharacterized protein I203_01684 [Kwoniella mangroviensis CBS 8507]OCF69820.1 hypothetical protein I203_01684 [Kwoniella mangroviensis CBS 8507]OCF71327.1 hypothetical protein I204_07954 [Kwoniella mangroviensis CBS 8886]
MSGTLSNVTLDDSSPAIVYIGDWDGKIHQGDPLVSQYSNMTFHASNKLGDSASFRWTGGQLWLFGAFRANHGWFSVTLDGMEKQYFDGQKDPDAFQRLMFQSGDLEVGEHELVLLNEADHENKDPALSWVDLDYIIVQADPAQFDPSSSSFSTVNMITTGTPRVQAVMPPTGTPKPVYISQAPGEPTMGLTGIFEFVTGKDPGFPSEISRMTSKFPVYR